MALVTGFIALSYQYLAIGELAVETNEDLLFYRGYLYHFIILYIHGQ